MLSTLYSVLYVLFGSVITILVYEGWKYRSVKETKVVENKLNLIEPTGYNDLGITVQEYDNTEEERITRLKSIYKADLDNYKKWHSSRPFSSKNELMSQKILMEFNSGKLYVISKTNYILELNGGISLWIANRDYCFLTIYQCLESFDTDSYTISLETYLELVDMYTYLTDNSLWRYLHNEYNQTK